MRSWLCRISCCLIVPFVVAGCATTEAGKAAADIALAGTGAVVGYQVSDGKTGPMAAGAAAGYLVSKTVQGAHARSLREAEKAGYERAMNQAVKQQYWIIQNGQKALPADNVSEPRLVPVLVPESRINGVIVKEHLEYLRIEP